MTYNANPPEEFVRANPGIKKFEVAPLDVELAKLVFAMTKRLPAELPAEGTFQPIVESYQPTWRSFYSRLGFIELACQADEADGERVLTITFWNQQHTTPYRYLLARGTTADMLKFIDSEPSLYHCKSCALWTDNLLINRENMDFEETYTWLLDYQERSNEFFVGEHGCGMVRYRSSRWGNKGLIVADEEARLAYLLVMPDGELTALLREEDFDWPAIEATGHAYEARCRKVDYRFDIGRYVDGVALVTWMLHPEGSYYADEDGFGRTDDEEVNISAYIDRRCRVLVKFQPMDSREREEELRKVALQHLEELAGSDRK